MCTVSFVPNRNGFYLAMNRDEKRSRATALAPAIVELDGHRAILPREPDGASWISLNDAGTCLALINWHRVERKPFERIASRGEIVRELGAKPSSDAIGNGLTNLPLRTIRPFRLIAVVPREKSVTEWRWNLEGLSGRKLPWDSQHWFSSGFDELQAEVERRRVCARAQGRPAARTLDWLRQLHRSHEPKRGPFSICMHRPDAATVSYTEVSVTGKSAVMRYADGSPCSTKSSVTKRLAIL